MRALGPASLCLAALLALAGCGGGGSTTATKPARTAPGGAAEREAPKGASPVLRAIYRNFPEPRADPRVPGSAGAIKRGERACEAKTPLEVKRLYIARAKLSPEQAKAVARLARYERLPPSPDFPAGQLAALVYEAAQKRKRLAPYAYQGCARSLAKRLERELAPGRKGEGR